MSFGDLGIIRDQPARDSPAVRRTIAAGVRMLSPEGFPNSLTRRRAGAFRRTMLFAARPTSRATETKTATSVKARETGMFNMFARTL
jgi:hypothetical protein